MRRQPLVRRSLAHRPAGLSPTAGCRDRRCRLHTDPRQQSRAPVVAQYDLVIRGGTVYDGSGNAPFIGDVAVHGDRIVAIDTGGRRRISWRA